ncbi:FeoA family protein [Tolypothrix tenuis PCC 7101]|uniref:FeoA family protein n=1 Tax=Tolypothrix tenuis PCC 7101 TaxID=231146 RepID=A0A1Z4N599_9CYAN|nr:ferrous iron transport protein A [Aulosira sp. FACHB-113]BAZ00886.1 FeoA family protein [Tolypothrix tenuis PCC 7101]BAZ75191.1 FeoA family protein [Aulosira laxa NIES-50]
MFTPFTIKGCSLELLNPGEQGIVASCKIPNEKCRQKVIAMGISVGTSITVKEKFPTFKIEVNNIIFSIDKEIARVIYVRILDS